MQSTKTENQVFFDKSKTREKACAVWLKHQNKAVRKPLLLTASAGIFNGLLVIAQAAFLAFILHAVIIDKVTLASIMPWLAVLTGVFILRGGCLYAYQIFGFEAGAQIKSSVRQQLLDSFLILGPSEIKHHQSGELASITLEQVEALENYFSRYLPQQMIVGIRYEDESLVFLVHLPKGFGKGRTCLHFRDMRALNHDIPDLRPQTQAQISAGMKLIEIRLIEISLFNEGHRQGVAHGQRRRRAGGGCQTEGAGLFGDAYIDDHIASPGQRR